jgi:predicted site-specific integrase-resolvase
VNTADAARLVQVSEATIRKWRSRGFLPDVPTAQDVWRCAVDRMRKREHARLDAAWERLSNPDH